MDYVNHINKFEDAQAIQAALDAGTLVNPYVAMTSAGTLDFNSLQPTPPAPSVYVQDSSGNKYYPTETNPGEFNFDFTMDITDMWALYVGGSIATIAFYGKLEQYCNGEYVGLASEYPAETPEELKNINSGGVPYDDPDMNVTITYQNNYASFVMKYAYCGGGSTSSS